MIVFETIHPGRSRPCGGLRPWAGPAVAKSSARRRGNTRAWGPWVRGRSRSGERRRHGAAAPASRGRDAASDGAPARADWPAWGVGAALFALALLLRLLYGHATPDAGWAYSAAFKGDALVWLDYARALRSGQPFDLGLPFHPPGNAWLIAALWDGREAGVRALRLWWDVFGALAALLVYAAARRACGPRPALVAGLWAAAATGPLILSSSLNNETPYFVLAAASLLLAEDLRRRPRVPVLSAWALLQALGCLFRVEHALFALAAGAWLVWRWRRDDPPAGARTVAARAALLAGVAALALSPWQLHAWRAVARFNDVPPVLAPAEQAARRQVAERLANVAWDAAALRRRDELPAFARETSALCVAATVAYRGGHTVHAEDFAVLEQGFGSVPRALGRFPFISLYGPLNFVLANHAGAGGGFSTSLLEEPPPAAARAGAFPRELLAGLPPPQLAFPYPPHLELVNDGYALGLRWIASRPLDFARLAWRKLRLFWSGAALGVTGYGLPLSASGTRRAVDLVTPPEGWGAGLWQLALLVLACAGLPAAVRHPGLHPWLLFLGSKLLVTMAFFGYARQGALVAPIVALLAALAFERRLAACGPRGFRRAVLAAAFLLAATEAARALHPPRISLDGRPIDAGDPLPADHHRAVSYEAR